MYISSSVRITLLLLTFCVRYFPIKSLGYDQSILLDPHSRYGPFWEESSAASDKLTASVLSSAYFLWRSSPSELDFILIISSINSLPRAILFSLSHRGTTQPLQRLKTFQPRGALCAPLPLSQQRSSSHSWSMCRPESNPSPPIHTSQWNVQCCNQHLYH